MISSKKIQLLVFMHGIAPHAEALCREDLNGSASVFGNMVLAPEVSRWWGEHDEKGDRTAGQEVPHSDPLPLWEGACNANPATMARRILDSYVSAFPPSAQPYPLGLSIPASTYIAGRCTSTFNLAWQLLANDMLPEWGGVLCSCQTEGRGQLRRRWHSPRGNLYVTFRLPHNVHLQGDAASIIVGGLLTRAFMRLGFSLFLKWPNDLLLTDSGKVGGILLEEKNGVILAGLGVNLAESPAAALLRADKATPATVLSAHHAQKVLPGGRDCAAQAEAPAHSGKHKNNFASGQIEIIKEFASSAFLSPFTVWQHLVSAAILEYNHWILKQSLPDILAGCDQLLAWKGRYVTLTETDGSSISGYCQGLGKNGGLLLRCANGRESEYFSGSLSLAAAGSVAAPEAFSD